LAYLATALIDFLKQSLQFTLKLAHFMQIVIVAPLNVDTQLRVFVWKLNHMWLLIEKLRQLDVVF